MPMNWRRSKQYWQSKGRAIVAYRTTNGNFKAVEDLTKVKGIGDKIIEKIKPEITTGE